MLTPAQCRAARGFLNWTLADLAKASGLSRASLNAFEGGKGNAKADTLASISTAFEQAGIVFDGEIGLRLETERLEVVKLTGSTGVKRLQDEIFRVCSANKSEVLFNGLDERRFEALDNSAQENHISRLRQAGIKERALLCQGDRYLSYPPDITTYRWLEPKLFGTITSVVFGPWYGIIIWGTPLEIVMMRSEKLAAMHRQQFEFLWNLAQPIPFTHEELKKIQQDLKK